MPTDRMIEAAGHSAGFSPPRTSSRSRSRRVAPALQVRLLFAATFVVFLLAGVVARLLPTYWLASKNGEGLFTEARHAAQTIIPYAFMG